MVELATYLDEQKLLIPDGDVVGDIAAQTGKVVAPTGATRASRWFVSDRTRCLLVSSRQALADSHIYSTKCCSSGSAGCCGSGRCQYRDLLHMSQEARPAVFLGAVLFVLHGFIPNHWRQQQ